MKEARRFHRHRIARAHSAGKPSRAHGRARLTPRSPSQQDTASIVTFVGTGIRAASIARDPCNDRLRTATRCSFVTGAPFNAHRKPITPAA